MPFKSESQRRFFYAANKRGDISDSDLNKWESETPKDKKLPDRLEKTAFWSGFNKEAFRVSMKTVNRFPIYGGLGLGALGGVGGYTGAGRAKVTHRGDYNRWKRGYMKGNPKSTGSDVSNAWRRKQTITGLGVGAVGGAMLGKMWKTDLLGGAGRRYYGSAGRRATGPATGKGVDQLKGMLSIGNVTTKVDAKKAFRAQAFKYHPDRGGNATRMTAINDAWSELQKSTWFNKLSFPFWLGFKKTADAASLGGGKGFGSVGTGSNANPIGELVYDKHEGTQESHGRAGGEDTRTNKELLDRERNPRDFAHGETGPDLVTPDGRIRY